MGKNYWHQFTMLICVTFLQSKCVLSWYLLKRGTTWNDLKQPETTYNKQETTWNNLKWPTMSKKQPEMTYIKQEMTWNNLLKARNDLQRARNDLKNDLKQLTTSKKTTWNNLKWPTTSKKRPEATWNDNISFWVT